MVMYIHVISIYIHVISIYKAKGLNKHTCLITKVQCTCTTYK